MKGFVFRSECLGIVIFESRIADGGPEVACPLFFLQGTEKGYFAKKGEHGVCHNVPHVSFIAENGSGEAVEHWIVLAVKGVKVGAVRFIFFSAIANMSSALIQ